MTSEVIEDHVRPPFYKKNTFLFDALIMKAQILTKLSMTSKVTVMLWRYFMISFTCRPFDLITTLNYVLLENFCPCFEMFWENTYIVVHIKKQ